eukprot:8966934-Alexandrium_andersonii.AAC.1
MQSGSFSSVKLGARPWRDRERGEDDLPRFGIRVPAWQCQVCHTPHSNPACVTCRACGAPRKKQQPPVPWSTPAPRR